ncbi:MAG: DegT/DnrJ/EryC1/StrS aminotransferase family protein [Polyangiaceae bacterium]
MSSDAPHIPFSAPSIGDEEIAEVEKAMREGWVTTGPRAIAFEKAFADYVGVPYARAVNSCTAALHIMLVASGVGPGDEVVIPSLTFAATGNVVEHVGATPVFADVDERTLCVTAAAIEAKLTPRTKAVILVHYAGLACPIDEVRALCEKRCILVMEDAAHAVGTRYRGKLVGAHTEGVSFSFYANKNMTTGEGGMLTTTREDLARRFESLRLHGMSKDAWKRYTAAGTWRYDIVESGFKYNLGDIAAAIGLVQLRKLEGFITRRNELAAELRKNLADLPGVEFQALAPEGDRHAYHLFVVRLSTARGTPDRETMIGALRARNVGFSVHFIPLHTMSHYKERWPDAGRELPVTERIADELLSLPLYPGMTSSDVDRVTTAVRSAFGRG